MEIDIVVKILGALGAVLVAIHQIVKALDKPRPRQALLEDLEILSKTPDNISGKDLLREHIKRSYESLYSPNSNRKKIDWSQVVMMPVFALGLGYWSYHLSKDEFSFWSIVTGIFAIGAIGALFDEFKDDKDQDDGEKSEVGKEDT